MEKSGNVIVVAAVSTIMIVFTLTGIGIGTKFIGIEKTTDM